MAAPAPLHADRRHGRTHPITDRGERAATDYTQSRLTNDGPVPHPKLHHVDGGDRFSAECNDFVSKVGIHLGPPASHLISAGTEQLQENGAFPSHSRAPAVPG